MMDGADYPTQTVALGAYTRMLLYSDGAYEIELADHSMWKHADFVDYLTSIPETAGFVADVLLEHIRVLGGAEILPDDYSVLEVKMG
jgi:sigma-B regulation protein RsbU (phosphoserine phosphatase)